MSATDVQMLCESEGSGDGGDGGPPEFEPTFDASTFASHTDAILFYATPHFGSPVANYSGAASTSVGACD